MKKTLLLAFTAVLLHGVSRAQTNWMDWRNGRPGVQVVTNAPSRAEHIALSNTVAGLSGVSVPTVGTMITNAIAAIHQSDPFIVRDSQDASYFQRLENGTVSVWQVTGPFTNYNVTLSADFLETNGSTRPAWTNHPWPFVDEVWRGSGAIGEPPFAIIFDDGAFVSYWSNDSYSDYPITIPAASPNAQGSAIVSQTVYYATNLYSTSATKAHLDAVETQVNNVNSNLNACYVSISNDLAALPASIQPHAVSVYGDFATTNTTGYAAFLATNPPYSELLSGGVTNGQRMARFRYAPSDSIESSVSFSGWAASGSTPATNLLSLFAVISIFDANGASVASASGAVKMVGAQLANASNFTASVNFSGIVSNASVVVDVFSATNTTRACAVVSGATTPAALTVSLNPLRYLSLLHTDVSATPDPHTQYLIEDGGTGTNISFVGTFTLLGLQWSWNTSRQTYDVTMPNGVVGQLFQENWIWCRNQTGALIENGKVVCSAGSVGDNTAIRLASRSDPTCKNVLIGMVTVPAGIAHGADGQVTTAGEVNGLPTASWGEVSNQLYLAENGNVTNVNVGIEPGKSSYYLGMILVKHNSDGRILFNPRYLPSYEDVGAVSPVEATNIAYAVNEITSIRYAISNVADVAGYLILTNAPSTNAVKQIVSVNPTNGQYIASFISEPFGTDGYLDARTIIVHGHITRSLGSTVVLRAEPYIVDALGNPVYEWTSGTEISISDVDEDGYEFRASIPVPVMFLSTYRRAVKIKVISKTGTPTVTILLENGKQLSVEVPVPSAYFLSKAEFNAYVAGIPLDGCGTLSLTGVTNLVVSGAYFSYAAFPTNVYQLSVLANAPRKHYSLTIIGTNDCTFSDKLLLRGTKTVTGTNCVAFKPFTNDLWEVLWGGK